jgi:hypothetical protein
VNSDACVLFGALAGLEALPQSIDYYDYFFIVDLTYQQIYQHIVDRYQISASRKSVQIRIFRPDGSLIYFAWRVKPENM